VTTTRAADAALLLLLAAAPAAAGAETAWRVRAEAGPGWDSNALRVAGGPSPDDDAFAELALRARGRVERGRWRLDAGLAEGLRAFAGASAADVLASRLDLGAARAVGARAEAGLDGFARDLRERGGARDQHEAQALAWGRLRAGRLVWAAGAGWSLFAPRAAGLRAFRRDGPLLQASATAALSREHSLQLRWGFSAAAHPGWPGGRDDRGHAAGLEWTWDGPVLVALGYGYARNDSSVAAGEWRRHRLTARVAASLPLEVTAAARAGLQRSSYPGGAALSEELFVGQGDETQNATELQLSRPLAGAAELVLRVAHYRSELGGGAALGFRRSLAQLAIAWEWGGDRQGGR
jgi:hypothetical protein